MAEPDRLEVRPSLVLVIKDNGTPGGSGPWVHLGCRREGG
jgi:hypothetical protein